MEAQQEQEQQEGEGQQQSQQRRRGPNKKRYTRPVRFGKSVRDRIQPSKVFGNYLLDRLEDANISMLGFCRMADHLNEQKLRYIIRGVSRDISTHQLVEFADILRCDPVEMVFKYLQDQGYWRDKPEEEVRSKAMIAYQLEIMPQLPVVQQEAVYNLIGVMAKDQGITTTTKAKK